MGARAVKIDIFFCSKQRKLAHNVLCIQMHTYEMGHKISAKQMEFLKTQVYAFVLRSEHFKRVKAWQAFFPAVENGDNVKKKEGKTMRTVNLFVRLRNTCVLHAQIDPTAIVKYWQGK